MKKLTNIILALALCLGLCGCGSKEPEGPPEPMEWVISVEYITQRVTEFAASEELMFLQDNYEALVDYHGNDKTYGPYLTGAAEVYALYGNGEGQHFILMGIEGDMQLALDTYNDRVQVVYDIDSDSYYDSLSNSRAELQDYYTTIKDTAINIALNGGSNYREALENIPNTFGKSPTNPGYVFYRELTADEVSSINTALGLEPIPPRGIEARPELNTTPEEHQRIIVDAVRQLAESELYYVLYPDFAIPTVKAAAEFAIETGFHNHSLIIQLDNAFTDGGHEGKIVADMNTGLVYTDTEFDTDWGNLDTPEKVAYLLASAYNHILSGAEEFFWSNATEANYKLTEAEIASINQELTEYFTQNPIEQPTEPPTETPAEAPVETPVDAPVADAPVNQGNEISVSEQFLADAVKSFRSGKRYQEIADDPSTIRITAAFEYTMLGFEGHNVHVLAVRVDGVDTDMWGFNANTFLVDIHTGNIWHDGNLDVNNWGDFSTLEDCFAAIICSPVWEQDQIWSENEIRTDLPQSMIDAANASLS